MDDVKSPRLGVMRGWDGDDWRVGVDRVGWRGGMVSTCGREIFCL